MRELTENEIKEVNGGSFFNTPTVATVAGTGGSAINAHTYNPAASNNSFADSIHHLLARIS